MKRSCYPWLVVMGLAHAAAAQAPGQVEATTAPFLERRVPEALATEGLVLSRNNLGLKIEQVGEQWLVSLVDVATERVAASTKLVALPPDREAAVAAMTHVVAELAAQIVGRVEHPTGPLAPPLAAPVPPLAPPVPLDDRAERDRRELADLTFQREAIRFSKAAVRGGMLEASTRRYGWVAFRGDREQKLAPSAFYAMVGRPDLAEGESTRRGLKIGGYVVGAAGFTAMMVLFSQEFSRASDKLDSCSFELPADQFDQCLDDSDPRLGTPLIAGGVGVLGILFGLWFTLHPHPIEADEARSLADQYNQGVRRRLGLPSLARGPLLRDLKLAPYVTGSTGGLALSARF